MNPAVIGVDDDGIAAAALPEAAAGAALADPAADAGTDDAAALGAELADADADVDALDVLAAVVDFELEHPASASAAADTADIAPRILDLLWENGMEVSNRWV